MATRQPLTALMTALGPGRGGTASARPPAATGLCQGNTGVGCLPRHSTGLASKLGSPLGGVWSPQGCPRQAGAAGRAHAHPLPPLPADGMGRAEGAAPAEPGDPDGSETGAISLRPVESISDLHWASGGQKGAEGESGARRGRASPGRAGGWALTSSLPCPQATARLPPAACAGPRLAPCPPAPSRSCPPCDLCPPPAPAPASAPATPCSWPCWGSWHWRAWSWPRWPST